MNHHDRAAQIGRLIAELTTLMSDPRPTRVEPTPTATQRVLFTVAEAAEQLGIGKTTAYSFVSSGELESVQIGRLRRIHADAIAAFAARLVSTNRSVPGADNAA
ncbi:helix-turn-helix domain-containing protein [Pseudonocardia sp. N23]|uniref:helix-turn-helix domain-containing protein n=1 Tax=Pseudonocardia sp. N23 TaxID=1987376 RepID=UPI000BFD40C9|nr:helix-turn-helix domain-containing protein [Pseudonocardia sp. N23]GAY11798.1 hypothetical protein TOK_0182 [Pseudonocardia sp. N23]